MEVFWRNLKRSDRGKEARYVDVHRAELIQRVQRVMVVTRKLLSMGRINVETYSQIRRAGTKQDRMRKLYEALDEGGSVIKSAFYSALRTCESNLTFLDEDYLFYGTPFLLVEPLLEEHGRESLPYKSSITDKCTFVTEYKLLSDERVELTARYTEPVIIQRSKEQTEKYFHEHVRSDASGSSQLLSNDKNHSIRIDQLFSPDCDGNTPKSVILSGDSGRGKSFMLQKIMLDWASGELYSEIFDVIFLLKFDEVKCLSQDMSLNELLSWNCSLSSYEISKILELTPEKILIIIDGVDEFSFDPHFQISSPTNPSQKALPMDTLRSLLNGQILPESFLLVTTRSDAGSVMNLLKGPWRLTEIVGFSERAVQEYFQKFFQDEHLFRKIYESVKTNERLLITCSVPLLCWMVCFCLKKHFTDDDRVMRELKTTTSIYVQFVSTQQKHHGQSQSVLRSLGQLAEEGMLDEEVLFGQDTMFKSGLDADSSPFLHKEHRTEDLIRKRELRFMHLSFQEFFMALYYMFFNEEESQKNIRDILTAERVKGKLSKSIASFLLFLCGLSNGDTSSSLCEKHNWTVPYIIRKEMENTILALQDEDKLFALHCLYELQDEEFVRRALGDWVSMDLSNISLRSTDCCVLLYCLQSYSHIRYLNLMNCDLTAEKLKTLQPVLCMCETLRLSVEHLSEAGDWIWSLGESNILTELIIEEDKYSAESPRWSLHLTFTNGEVLLFLSSSEIYPSFPSVLNISLTCPQSEISSTNWTLFFQRLSKTGNLADDSSPALDERVSLLLSSFHSVGLKTLDLKLVSLNKSCASGIISLVQTCTSLQQLRVSVTGLLLEEQLTLLNKSLTDPHCAVIIEGLTVSKPEPSGLNLQPLSVCQSCVHIVDSDQWVQVEPSVCTDEGGSEFRISTPAGRFECSRTRMRWVCAGDVTLQYRAVDGAFLRAELERLQCERIGPVIDVTVISGKLEEAHLPHYACLAESDPSLGDAVRLLTKSNEGISLQSVELTLNDTFSKEKVEQNEKSSFLISHPRPDRPFQLKTPHHLEVPGASVHPVEGISFRTDIDPNFFKVRKQQFGDVQLNLIREEDKKSVWKATIWKEEFGQLNPILGERSHEDEELKQSKEAQFVDRNYAVLVQRVTSVKAIADELKNKGMIHNETLSRLKKDDSNQDKMRRLFEALNSGGDRVKNAFYYALKNQEPYLFKDLDGDN